MCIFSLQAGLPARASCDPLDLSLPLAYLHPDCVSTGSCGVQHPACPRRTYSTRPHLCPTPCPSPTSTALRLPLLSQSPAASALPASFASSASPDSTVHHSVQSLAVVSVFFLLSLHLPGSAPALMTPHLLLWGRIFRGIFRFQFLITSPAVWPCLSVASCSRRQLLLPLLRRAPTPVPPPAIPAANLALAFLSFYQTYRPTSMCTIFFLLLQRRKGVSPLTALSLHLSVGPYPLPPAQGL